MSALERFFEISATKKESKTEFYQRLSTPSSKARLVAEAGGKGTVVAKSAKLDTSAEKKKSKLHRPNTSASGSKWKVTAKSDNAITATRNSASEDWKRLARIDLLRNAGFIEDKIAEEIIYHIGKSFSFSAQVKDSDDQKSSTTSILEPGGLEKFEALQFITNITFFYNMYHDEDGEDFPKSSFVVYLAEGDKLYTAGDFQKALDSYGIALDLEPTNVTGLVARSKCYLQIGDAQSALQDAEASLKENENYHRGLYQKAEALYQMGDFEYALMFYHRGHKVRPELEQFRLGIQKAQEAIDNCVGTPSSVKLENKGDLSFFNKMDEGKKPKPRLAYKPNTKGTAAAKQARLSKAKTGTSSRTAKALLGELYADKEYLEKLLRDEDLVKGTAGGMSIYDLVTSGISYLDTRTEFWRQQKPMYARKRDRMMMQHKWSNKSSFNRSNATATDATTYILKNLEEIDQNLADGKAASSLQLASSTLRAVEKLSEKELPNKMDIIANLHSCIGNACLELGQTDRALDHHMKDLELAKLHKIQDAKSRALDNLGRVHARVGQFKKAIRCWEEKIPLSKSALENTWLFHEIGRCYLEIGDNVEEAREYGQRSFAEAKKAEDQVWELNAGVLIAQANVKLDQYEAAIQSFERALETANQLEDSDAQVAINKALDEVREKLVPYLAEKSKQHPMPAKPDPIVKRETEAKATTSEVTTSLSQDSKSYSLDLDLKGGPVEIVIDSNSESKASSETEPKIVGVEDSDVKVKPDRSLKDSRSVISIKKSSTSLLQFEASKKESKDSLKSSSTLSDKKSNASVDKSAASGEEDQNDVGSGVKDSEEESKVSYKESKSSLKSKRSDDETKSVNESSDNFENRQVDIDDMKASDESLLSNEDNLGDIPEGLNDRDDVSSGEKLDDEKLEYD